MSEPPPPTQGSAAEPPPSIAHEVPEDCFRILLATDNHIGYAEKDPVRGQDAINTFREILEIAKEKDVDFILLAGDLFHENRPSRTCMHQVIALLREYTLGDKPVPFELLSDPYDGSTPGFSFPAVNYEDPNLNVAIPVFSIHGNHDDPQGTGPEGALCALDVLSVSGVLNYFGRVHLSADEATETEDSGIRIKPILLRKGNTNLAMYGVGNVKDTRMHYELRSNRVKMYMPETDEEWFNMLLIHQNRVKHGIQSHVPEGMFDDSIQLVMWGHEHDCRIQPEKVEGKNYFVTQPGSSVATSLAPGEALPKNVGLLSVQGTAFHIEPIPLKTVRPFELEEVHLAEVAASDEAPIDLEDKDTITAFLREKVEELIVRARVKWEETHDANTEEMMLPLVRIKVETTGAKEMTNPVRFGQDYIGRVANPRDILQYHRKKQAADRKLTTRPDMPDFESELGEEVEEDGEEALTVRDRLAKLQMSTLVRGYLKAQNLEVLKEEMMEEAVMRFVDKDDKDAIKDFYQDSLKSYGKNMRGVPVRDEEDLEEHFERLKEAAAAELDKRRSTETGTKGKGRAGKRTQESDQDSMAYDSMMEEDEPEEPPKRVTKKAATSARSTRTAKKQPLFDPSESPDEDPGSDQSVELVESSPDPPPRKRGATRATTTTRSTKAATTSSATRKATSTSAGGSSTRGRGRGKAASSGGTQTQLSFSRAPRATGRKLVDSSDSD